MQPEDDHFKSWKQLLIKLRILFPTIKFGLKCGKKQEKEHNSVQYECIFL